MVDSRVEIVGRVVGNEIQDSKIVDSKEIEEEEGSKRVVR